MKFKAAYRHAEALVASAEATDAIVAASFDQPQHSLCEAWDAILFNSFHDILPGSSIERAFEDQAALAGLSAHQAQRARFHALNRLALRVDTSVPPAGHPDRPTDVPLLVWNPLPRAYRGWVELEAALDYRPLAGYTAALNTLPLSLTGPDGEKVAFQEIATENYSMRDMAWRKRLAVFTEIPPLGWKVFRLGYRDQWDKSDQAPKNSRSAADACAFIRGKTPSIRNRDWKLQITPSGLMRILFRGKNFLGGSGAMKIQVEEDIWGSWGAMDEGKNFSHPKVIREQWSICDSAVLEEGPERVTLWTRWQGLNSWLDLTFMLGRDAREVGVKGRLLWNERSSRLNLVLPASGPLVMQVPGSEVERAQPGHLPCGRWFRCGVGEGSIGFVSDVLGDVVATEKEIHVTLARASRYADDVPTAADEEKWRPAVDCGELKFEFWLAPGTANLTHLAQELVERPVVVTTSAHPGSLPGTGSLARLEPDHVTLLSACLRADGDLQVRVQNSSREAASARLIFGERSFSLGALSAFEIKTAIVRTGTGKKRMNGAPAPGLERTPALAVSRNGRRSGSKPISALELSRNGQSR
jgi:alpha-mannosidase